MGLANFYRKFIRWFSEIASPLKDLTKKDRKFEWGPKEEEAFERLKTALVSAPVLQLPDFDREFTVTTDASEVSVGGILQQNFGQGLQPVAYESRKLNPTKCRYSAYEHKMLGIVWAVGKWRHYLAGQHFTIQTDHNSLKNLPNQPSVNRRVWKWIQVLQGYDCDIMHIAGKVNPADYLSRHSVKELKSMVDIRAHEESMVQRLQLGDEEVTEEHIQDKLDQVFKETDAVRASVILSECHPLLSATRSRISLDSSMRDRIRGAYESDDRWADIVIELRSDPQRNLVKRGVKDYRLAHDCIEIHNREGPDEVNRWRLVIPNIP